MQGGIIMCEKLESFFIDCSNEFSEYISSQVFQIRNKNPEYKKLLIKTEKILDKYPRLRSVLEDDEVSALSIEECEALVEIQNIKQCIDVIEEKEIFFLGSKELYQYLKKIDALK